MATCPVPSVHVKVERNTGVHESWQRHWGTVRGEVQVRAEQGTAGGKAEGVWKWVSIFARWLRWLGFSFPSAHLTPSCIVASCAFPTLRVFVIARTITISADAGPLATNTGNFNVIFARCLPVCICIGTGRHTSASGHSLASVDGGVCGRSSTQHDSSNFQSACYPVPSALVTVFICIIL